MRPVNLIPPEERRGDKAPLRTGPLAYAVVAVLAAVLLAVTLVVLTGNQISDRKAEKSQLQAELTQAQAQAKRLNAFAEFATLQQARQETVTSLATSRFDWERVLREMAIVIPSDVWLTDLTASASADAAASASTSTTSSTGTEGILGPSLQISGCAEGHDGVARFLASLRDIDGVTRVSVMSSDQASATAGATSTSSTASTSASGSCTGGKLATTFEIVVAFDDAQTSAPTTTPSPTSPDPAETSQVADGRNQLKQQSDSASQKVAKGHDAANTFIPGTGTTP